MSSQGCVTLAKTQKTRILIGMQTVKSGRIRKFEFRIRNQVADEPEGMCAIFYFAHLPLTCRCWVFCSIGKVVIKTVKKNFNHEFLFQDDGNKTKPG